jgi:acetolactate synthase I/II/III large subunit
LASSSMKTIVCRHEQNAAFIAGGIGRLTGHLKLNLVHMIWIDQHYDMVEVQEQAKYGRASGVDFGPIDVVKYTEAFGARGFMISSADEIAQVLHKAFEMPGPVLIGIPVDYRDNHLLFETSPSIC